MKFFKIFQLKSCPILNLQGCKLTFTQKQFYGNEYFEGNKYEMIEIISNYIITNNKECKRKEYIKKETDDKKKEREKEKDRRDKEETEKKKKEKKKMKEEIKIIECPKCNVDFKYISILKRHLENSARCSSNDVYIKNTINNINQNTNTDNLFICNDCNKHFKFKTSIYRHKSISKCAKNKNKLQLT